MTCALAESAVHRYERFPGDKQFRQVFQQPQMDHDPAGSVTLPGHQFGGCSVPAVVVDEHPAGGEHVEGQPGGHDVEVQLTSEFIGRGRAFERCA